MTGNDEQDIRELLRAQEEAVARGNAGSVVAPIGEDIVNYDLPPPLENRGATARDPALFEKWFATWDGPVTTELRDPTVIVDGDLAVAFGLSLMSGNKRGSGPFSGWNRRTVVLRRANGAWRIVHEHSSYPMAMDGSGRAATDLLPEFTGDAQ
jgi:ketosteroid isomerase-like protein